MLNHIVIMGRLTRDPELKTTNNGVPVVSFRLPLIGILPTEKAVNAVLTSLM